MESVDVRMSHNVANAAERPSCGSTESRRRANVAKADALVDATISLSMCVLEGFCVREACVRLSRVLRSM